MQSHALARPSRLWALQNWALSYLWALELTREKDLLFVAFSVSAEAKV